MGKAKEKGMDLSYIRIVHVQYNTNLLGRACSCCWPCLYSIVSVDRPVSTPLCLPLLHLQPKQLICQVSTPLPFLLCHCLCLLNLLVEVDTHLHQSFLLTHLHAACAYHLEIHTQRRTYPANRVSICPTVNITDVLVLGKVIAPFELCSVCVGCALCSLFRIFSIKN